MMMVNVAAVDVAVGQVTIMVAVAIGDAVVVVGQEMEGRVGSGITVALDMAGPRMTAGPARVPWVVNGGAWQRLHGKVV